MSEEIVSPTREVWPVPARANIGAGATGARGALSDHIAIVGGGFSGTLMAVNLLRYGDARVTLIERGAHFARGAAYSTNEPAHFLNVRAENMSALPDQPDHFVKWLRRHDCPAPHGFAARRDYGRYLWTVLAEAMAAAPGRVYLMRASVDGIHWGERHACLTLSDGGRLRADAVVLALGNMPPHDPAGLASAGLADGVYCADPWAGALAEGLGDDDTVFIVGTGLTMVDVALSLDSAGFRGRIVALSRRGLMARAHTLRPAPSRRLEEKPAETGAALLRRIRNDSARIGWRGAIDALRPFSQALWLGASDAERSRFLRHPRPWWDVHRHRLAPQVAEGVTRLQAEGRLRIVAGRLGEVNACLDGADVAFRPRGSERDERVIARRIVNCTGPQSDVRRSADPLLRQLLASGQIRPDRTFLGIDTTGNAEVIDTHGLPNPRLMALGPLTRGTFWEINAVPDIRVQAWSLARRLCAAHWVEGEGL